MRKRIIKSLQSSFIIYRFCYGQKNLAYKPICEPPHLELRLRTIKYAYFLANKGYEVTVFASSVMHNMNINLIKDGIPYLKKSYGKINFVHINTVQYGNSYIKRVLASIQFHKRFIKFSAKFGKPDVIVQCCSCPIW